MTSGAPAARRTPRRRYRTATQTSSGGVIFRAQGGRTDICLIARRSAGRRLIWGLPKGHVEPGEHLLQTALREVREETGLRGEPVAALGAITYWFAVPEERVRFFKTVHFHLLRFVSGRTEDHDHEVERAAWLPIDQARRRLAYANERKIVANAAQHLRRMRHDPTT